MILDGVNTFVSNATALRQKLGVETALAGLESKITVLTKSVDDLKGSIDGLNTSIQGLDSRIEDILAFRGIDWIGENFKLADGGRLQLRNVDTNLWSTVELVGQLGLEVLQVQAGEA